MKFPLKFIHHRRSLVVILFIIVLLLPLPGQEVCYAGKKSFSKPGVVPAASNGPQSTLININNLSVWATNNGMLERRPDDLSAGVSFPRGTSTLVHASGIVWGGIVRDGAAPAIRIGGGSYIQGLLPGRIIRPGVAENPSNSDVRIYRIRPDWKSADLKRDASELLHITEFDVTSGDIENVRIQYLRDWLEWPWQQGAPYLERNGIPGYQPDTTGDPNADLPGIAGAGQTVWFVTNDLDEGTTARLYGSPPIGLELQVTCWAYNGISTLNNTVFERFRIIYKGTTTTPSNAVIDSMYIGKWSDPDVGDYSDDLVGSSPDRNLAYAYNYGPSDAEYQKFNTVPPVVGYRLLEGPRVSKTGGEAHWNLRTISGQANLAMTGFTFFEPYTRIADYDFSTYTGSLEWWNLFRGYKSSPVSPPVCRTNPGSGNCTPFDLTGDPETFRGWIDGVNDLPGDRRMLLSSGPFSMAYGDSQEVVIALMAALGTDNRNGLSLLRQMSDDANDAFQTDFSFPDTVPAPNLRVVELDRQLILDWESDTTHRRIVESYASLGYKFESYTVYQLPRPDAGKDEATVYQYFDPIQPRYLMITSDHLRNQPVVNGQEYYFAVTTTAYNPDMSLKKQWIESPMIVHTCVPHAPNPGTVYPYGIGDLIQEGTNIVGASDAVILLSYFDPSKPDGHRYTMTFHRDTDPFRDFLTKPDWTLVDSTTGDTIIRSQVDLAPVRVPSKGFSLQVLSPRFGLKGVFQTEFNGQTMNDTVFNQPNPGGNYMVVAGGLSDLDTIRGWAYTDIDVELRFTGDSSWGLIRKATAPLSRWVRLPFTAWQVGKIGRDTIFKQTYAVVNDAGGDSLWRPGITFTGQTYNGEPFHAFYPVSIMGDSIQVGLNNWYGGTYYDDAPFRSDATVTKAVLYTVGSQYSEKISIRKAYIADLDGDGIAAPKGTVIRFRQFKEIRSGDEKLFTLQKTVTDDLASARKAVEAVNVFPNPYYGMNRAETSRFNGYVTFSHLPWKATIRVFNLAGVLVRTLRKDDVSQFVRWDLKNESGLSAAAGLYLVHLQMSDAVDRDLGEKILKLMIVPEDPTPQRN